MRLSGFFETAAVVVLAGGMIGWALTPASGQILIVGNDEKQGFDENAKPIVNEPGKDTLSIIDIAKPEAPRVAATIPLINSAPRSTWQSTRRASSPLSPTRSSRSRKAGRTGWIPTTKSS